VSRAFCGAWEERTGGKGHRATIPTGGNVAVKVLERETGKFPERGNLVCGEIGRGRPKDRFDNIKAIGGTSSSYLAARLKRDYHLS
jgi:hypothetical protein